MLDQGLRDVDGGGGILCVSSSPTLMNVVFSGNQGSLGGGLLCDAGAQPLLVNCVFEQNTAVVSGGGCPDRAARSRSR